MSKAEELAAKMLTEAPVRWKAKVRACPSCGRTVLTTERLIPGGGSQTTFVAHSRVEPTGWSARTLALPVATPYQTCEQSGKDVP
jgi:hypothetical protein